MASGGTYYTVSRWNGPGMQRLSPAMIRFRESKTAREEAIPARSVASLSSPLVLAQQVRARCMRPPGLTGRVGKHSLGLQARGSQPLRSIFQQLSSLVYLVQIQGR